MIAINNSNIGYSSVLFSIENMQLQKGEIYALIGSNGAGKSTFFSTLTKQITPLDGTINIDTKTLITYSAKELAKKIAFVQSKSDLPDFLTVQAYLELGRTPYTTIFGRLSKNDRQIIENIVNRLNIESFLTKYMHNLSDGERQIMAIGRALIQDTPIVILDEPTAFLDYGNRVKIIQLLKEIAEKENKCILFSSHDIELCLETIQDIIYIDFVEKKMVLTHNIEKEALIQQAFPTN